MNYSIILKLTRLIEVDEIMEEEKEEEKDEEEKEDVKEEEEKELYNDLPINFNSINPHECADFMMGLLQANLSS